MHSEKTAGSTLSAILSAHFGRERYISIGSRKNKRAAVGELRRLSRDPADVAGIRGHVPLGVMMRHLPPDTRYFTLLRDPLERTASHYFHLREGRQRRVLSAQVEKRSPREGASIAETLQRPRVLVDNLQTRMLIADPWAWRAWREPLAANALEDAIRTLRERVVAFGLTEHFDDALAAILGALRVPLPGDYENLKVSERPTFSELTTEDQEAIRAANSIDQELYSFASGFLRSET